MIIGGAFGPRKAFKVENMIQRSGFASLASPSAPTSSVPIPVRSLLILVCVCIPSECDNLTFTLRWLIQQRLSAQHMWLAVTPPL